MTDPSDVSAVVLTMGEPGTEDALAALRRQTLPPRETIVVQGVSPFHQAINTGARHVGAPFFVQVDADMILDPGCLAELRGAVRRNTGIVVGHLRDALIGRVVGVKLFRTAPFREVMMGDTISPDTDLGGALRRAGWKTVYTGRLGRGDPAEWRTYGEHRPGYDPEYTWRKYLLEGRRYRYRENPDGIRWHFGRLEASGHASALIARIAMANGIFLESDRDLLGRMEPDEGYARLAGFLAATGGGGPDPGATPEYGAPLEETFDSYYELGQELFRTGDSGRFRQALGALVGSHGSSATLVATVALCRGVLASDQTAPAVAAEFAVLREFLTTPDVHTFEVLRGLAARLRRWLGRRRSEGP
jgi:hypothetical protein